MPLTNYVSLFFGVVQANLLDKLFTSYIISIFLLWLRAWHAHCTSNEIFTAQPQLKPVFAQFYSAKSRNDAMGCYNLGVIGTMVCPGPIIRGF